MEVNRLHLAFTLSPFDLIMLGGLASTAAFFSIFLRINRQDGPGTDCGVLLSVKSYWVCHLARHMHSKCIASLAPSKGKTCFVEGTWDVPDHIF